MKKTVIRDLDTEKDMVRFNPFQMVFAVYSLIFMLLSRKRLERLFDFTISLPVFLVLFVSAVVLSAAVLIYNRKNETRQTNKMVSYAFALGNVGFGLYWLLENV